MDAIREEIDRLTRELAALKQTNLELQARIDKLLAPSNSPDELAAALQNTVDSLQRDLASLSNPISNFAVKEFRLETALTVGITDMGRIEYRLLRPGMDIDPAAISKLTLSLVPIEKSNATGTLDPQLFEPAKELSTTGMSTGLREVLERNHIFTIGDFRSAAMRAQVRAFLVSTDLTTQQELKLLQSRAELLMLTGVDLHIADALIAAHIDSLQRVARSTADNLRAIVPEVEKPMAEQWISAARAFTATEAPEVAPQLLVVDTKPANLLVRIGDRGYLSPAPLQRQLPAKQEQAVRTFSMQLQNGTGYLFTGWSTGAAEKSIAVLPSDRPVAGFRIVCYAIEASVKNCIIDFSPAAGNVSGFPANCHAPGSKVRVTVTPASGYGIRQVEITSGGKTQTNAEAITPVIVNGPLKVVATCVPQPMTVPTIFPPEVEGKFFFSNVSFENPTPTPGKEVRVMEAQFRTVDGAGTVTLSSKLPIVFGDLPAGGRTAVQRLVYAIPPEVKTFEIMLAVEVRNPGGDLFANRVSMIHGRPEAAKGRSRSVRTRK